jgi:hypothetical protein
MRIYVDTSVIIAAHTREPKTVEAQNWLAEQNSGVLILSSWMLVECTSALAIKQRRAEITEKTRLSAESDIDALVAYFSPVVIPVESDYAHARQLCRYVSSNLRAGDSLHLAVAIHEQATHFATFDSILAGNAVAQGILLVF